MKKILVLIFFSVTLFSCKSEKKSIRKEINTETFETSNFELIKTIGDTKAVLILFGGFGENPTDIKREFKILDITKKNQITLILMNYSKKLWLEEFEKKELAKLLQETLEKHNLNKKDIYIGGFSSGGIMSLQISNYIIGMKEFYIDPKGVFIVDSPIDLLELYKASKKNISRDFSSVSVEESKWLINTLEKKLGNPEKGISKYEKYSTYTLETDYIKNLKKLNKTKIRLYTEPDTIWWKENRMADYEQMNAFHIKKLYESLKRHNFKEVEYIPTKNKGYRADGERHPHSWSIINKEDLINWILN
ncbi:hypothetical protein QVZ41_13850 [Wenyingzhuangia sp. chi5]|uniref:Uncharacterized protein n=1 Tax=Wenyingzhuangia gilva TaxID=3057677 RepID=A0ABT8VVC1_9FLAO|nr:hypothetical protein [Wenyingzhuangia sp. chi5]MDO3695930.1 hypothetical protein [Wenyingzhuangia sp. chi5]